MQRLKLSTTGAYPNKPTVRLF